MNDSRVWLERYHGPLAGALLLAAVAVMVGLIAWPLWQQNVAYSQSIQHTWQKLQQYRATVESGPRIEEKLQELRDQGLQRYYYSSGGTPAIVATELQKRVKQLLDAGDGRLVSTQVVSDPPEGPHPRVAIRVQAQSGMEGVRRVFHGLLDKTPLMFVDNVQVRPVHVRRRRGSEEPTPQLVRVGFELATYLDGSRR